MNFSESEYELDQLISSTGLSQVWTAITADGDKVAVKWAAPGEVKARRFQREIDAMRAAAGPSTMPILDYDADDYSWYTMPVAAFTLDDLETPADVQSALEVLEALVLSLGPMHQLGYVHRDLKPQNILRLEDGGKGRWVVADFGIVRNVPGLTTSPLTRAGGLLGTDRWAAPEQRNDAHEATPRADIYASGAIVSWILTGVIPDYVKPVMPQDLALRAVVQRALSHEPLHRYATMDELLQNLRTASTPSGASFDSIIATGSFGQLSGYISSHSSNMASTARKLVDVSWTDIGTWYGEDPGGVVRGVSAVAESFLTDRGGLSYGEVDRFLNWSVDVLRWLVSHGQHPEAESLATDVFAVVGQMGQFRPTRTITDWVASLGKRGQGTIEAALRASGYLGHFEVDAADRWARDDDNELIRRLRDGL